MKSSGFLARLAALHARPGTSPRWWVIPALLLYDATGLFGFVWIIFELQKIAAQLALRAEVVDILLPIYFISLCGLFLPATHIVAVLINWGQRRRKPVLGLREKQWWGILWGFSNCLDLSVLHRCLDDRRSLARTDCVGGLYQM